ncbi:MAG: CNP1-like family protein [Rhodocyclaceae bacterium]|nr:CNP1-like family protein [Rhodocyclaceae bacterium]
MMRLAVLSMGFLAVGGMLVDAHALDRDDPDAPQWAEAEVELPAFPQPGNLREFYVSGATTHKFAIDATTLSVGKDGVVRYVLVVRTSGGATNTSFEGIRCESGEFRIYATGHQDGQWARVRQSARQSEWRRIENKPVNRHHAALARELFCPNGTPIRNPAEGREALRLGRHPAVAQP